MAGEVLFHEEIKILVQLGVKSLETVGGFFVVGGLLLGVGDLSVRRLDEVVELLFLGSEPGVQIVVALLSSSDRIGVIGFNRRFGNVVRFLLLGGHIAIESRDIRGASLKSAVVGEFDGFSRLIFA